jgi:UDP-N-acetylmuramoyl-L-alanyl-D-glutamate--2,6-diaminopimelate ligase
VAGLGRAGTAAARALALHAGAAEVRAWDAVADTAQLAAAEQLRRLAVDVVLGGEGLDALDGVQTLVKSPGVSPDSPVVAEAVRRGLPVIDELELGWLLVVAPTVAVTGTNGKSTVAGLLVAVLDAHGLGPVLTGNTEFGPPLSELSLGEHPRSLVAEVSSYQAQCSPGLAVDGAVFTNLTPDHLNWHKTMEAYGAAKRALFVRGERVVPVAALNVDDELGRTIARDVEERGGRALRCGRGNEADYRIVDCRWGLGESELEVDTPAGRVNLTTRLPGLHNAANVTSVLALADGLGLARDRTVAAISGMTPVPGRFEVIDVDCPFDVVVDFAHSTDSVVAVLATARAVVEPRGGRLVTVLGLIGRAGRLSGREVGRVAAEASDHLVLSGVSYRGEPRIVTLAELAAGARGVGEGGLEILIDRRAAIARALAEARPGDVVAIVGRGATVCEATDRRGGVRLLDDRQVAREVASCMS